MVVSSRIIGHGHYLPHKVLTNDDLSTMMDTSDTWIRGRTGIGQRHIADDSESTSDLATHAGRHALTSAGLSAEMLDMIIVATTTPDYTFPSTASRVQEKLGAGVTGAFDVQAVCAGFLHALTIGDSLIKAGVCRTCLVIGAEICSRIIDWSDRSTCVLFGDGAGAIILEAYERDEEEDKSSMVIGSVLRADGRDRASLHMDGGVSSTRTIGLVRMDGRDVFKKAVERLADVSLEALSTCHMAMEQVDWLIPHQANMRIVQALGKRLRIGQEKLAVTIERHGNTSAASIPLVMSTYIEDGRIQRGQTLLIQAIGGGLTWGASLLRF
ncbi:MAG: ketoacyl-ACP synthase III [Alphaproteobacteria bacterium GM7ARS4]|nr:ketoacyl-ACP synthase III [Alphaproteobacteria bacterium GM7ARS4]